MKVSPILDRILVKPAEAETKTAGGLFIPETAQDAPVKGEVIGVGDGRVTDNGTVISLKVKQGDTVLFSKGQGTIVTIDSEEHIILNQDQVLAVVE